ncbi:hypothetical protein LEP1GSC070_1631 [Leptospira santarosai str. AIM]|nr:hypothetical protein LEP1GSC070_1631 [Leptospira santarosai str. AIM]
MKIRKGFVSTWGELDSYSELYNRVSKILLQNGDRTQNEWCPIL